MDNYCCIESRAGTLSPELARGHATKNVIRLGQQFFGQAERIVVGLFLSITIWRVGQILVPVERPRAMPRLFYGYARSMANAITSSEPLLRFRIHDQGYRECCGAIAVHIHDHDAGVVQADRVKSDQRCIPFFDLQDVISILFDHGRKEGDD